jgi:hypothetical protein
MPKRYVPAVQMALPGAIALSGAGKTIPLRNDRIPHKRILEALQNSGEARRGIVELYRQEVLPIKTRTIHLLGRKSSARIIHTLLGFEVQASFKRIQCPDMVTARYLKLFSEIGARTIRLPYDPTVTARLIPLFEDSIEALRRGVRELFPRNPQLQTYVEQRVFRLIRSQLRRASG